VLVLALLLAGLSLALSAAGPVVAVLAGP